MREGPARTPGTDLRAEDGGNKDIPRERQLRGRPLQFGLAARERMAGRREERGKAKGRDEVGWLLSSPAN